MALYSIYFMIIVAVVCCCEFTRCPGHLGSSLQEKFSPLPLPLPPPPYDGARQSASATVRTFPISYYIRTIPTYLAMNLLLASLSIASAAAATGGTAPFIGGVSFLAVTGHYSGVGTTMSNTHTPILYTHHHSFFFIFLLPCICSMPCSMALRVWPS